MNHQIKSILPIFCFFLLFSCQPAEKTLAKTKSTSLPPQLLIDHDPYFNPVDSIDTKLGPSSITRNIIQDKKGIIWLATWNGIMNYDGTTFHNMTNSENLRRYRAFVIEEMDNNDIWIGTIGAGLYQYANGKFKNYTKKDGLLDDSVTNFFEHPNGDLWVGTGKGISIFDGKTFSNLSEDDGLPNTDINSIVQVNTENYWIGARGAASVYNGKEFQTLNKPDGMPFTNVRSIIKDSRGLIWLGGNDGLWRYDGQTFVQIINKFTGYIYEDALGNIWTSTEISGPEDWAFIRFDSNTVTLPEPQKEVLNPGVGMLFGIEEDNQGNIWFGTLNGVGKWDGKEFQFL